MSKYNYEKSRTVLQALIHGVDPETGNELMQDTILNRVDVVRALLASKSALDALIARSARRALLPASVGMAWTTEEEQQLSAESQRGDPIAKIAERHGRTVRAIEARLERLRLSTAEQRATQHFFFEGRPKEGP